MNSPTFSCQNGGGQPQPGLCIGKHYKCTNSPYNCCNGWTCQYSEDSFGHKGYYCSEPGQAQAKLAVAAVPPQPKCSTEHSVCGPTSGLNGKHCCEGLTCLRSGTALWTCSKGKGEDQPGLCIGHHYICKESKYNCCGSGDGWSCRYRSDTKNYYCSPPKPEVYPPTDENAPDLAPPAKGEVVK